MSDGKAILRNEFGDYWMIDPSHMDTLAATVEAAVGGQLAASNYTAPRIGRGTAQTAVVPIHGTIVPRRPSGSLGERLAWASCAELAYMIADAVADKSVSRVVLDINSPGGVAIGVPELARKIRDMRLHKQIIAVTDTMACSAAYYLAAQATKFFVAPSAFTGSVGVLTLHADLSKSLERAGVKYTFVHAGQYKVEGNPYEPLGKVARTEWQKRVDAIYDDFISDVAAGRGLTSTVVKKHFGEGRTVRAQDAVDRLMADGLGTLEDVLLHGTPERAAKMQNLARAVAIDKRRAAANDNTATERNKRIHDRLARALAWQGGR